MSSILSAPPQRIPIGGQGGDAPTGPMPGIPGGSPGAEGGAGAQGGPDMPGVKKALQAATDSLMEAAQLEGDDADKAQIMQLVAKVHALVASHQQLADHGDGRRAGRQARCAKAAPAGGGGGPGY
jgi:hypothetical protein